MLFNSVEYLLGFLPLAVLGYFALGARPALANAFVTVASLVFYAWWNPPDLVVIVISITVNFLVARTILTVRGSTAPWVAVGIVFNLLLLGYFKYAGFAAAIITDLGGHDAPFRAPESLPLGISFFTFTQIAFLVDLAQGKAREPSFTNYSLFVTFFPHLLAGPILHHREMMPQFARSESRRPDWDNIAAGLFLIAIGLGKKVLLADNLAGVANVGYANIEALTAPTAWLITLAYTFQLYFDFSGYTDIAVGSARLFNIRFPENFRSPYLSRDLGDFWRRWHVTLGRFLRDYVYLPLRAGGNGFVWMLVCVALTFLIGGLWHGAGWTFIAWGAYHAAGMVALRLWRRSRIVLPALAGWALTFLFVHFGWVLFRADSLAAAGRVWKAMLDWQVPAVVAPSLVVAQTADLAVLAGAAVAALWRANSNQLAERFRPSALAGGVALLLLAGSVSQMNRVTQFLYFNF